MRFIVEHPLRNAVQSAVAVAFEANHTHYDVGIIDVKVSDFAFVGMVEEVFDSAHVNAMFKAYEKEHSKITNHAEAGARLKYITEGGTELVNCGEIESQNTTILEMWPMWQKAGLKWPERWRDFCKIRKCSMSEDSFYKRCRRGLGLKIGTKSAPE